MRLGRVSKKRSRTFSNSEKNLANVPLKGGPFRSFVESLNQLKSEFKGEINPIRTALVTARSSPAHERVVKTLRPWGMSVDEFVSRGNGKSKFPEVLRCRHLF